jgi:hypothetical protein
MKTFTSHSPETDAQRVAYFVKECLRRSGDDVNRETKELQVVEVYLIGNLMLIHTDGGTVFSATVEEMTTVQ